MKIYGIPELELKEWTPEREHLMTRKIKILFKELPKIKLVKMVTVDDILKYIEIARTCKNNIPAIWELDKLQEELTK